MFCVLFIPGKELGESISERTGGECGWWCNTHFVSELFCSEVEASNAHAQGLNFEQKRKKDIGQEKLGKEAKASCPIAQEDTELERKKQIVGGTERGETTPVESS